MVIAEKAFGEDGNLKQPKELSINKVGHGLSPSFSYPQKPPFMPVRPRVNSSAAFASVANICHCLYHRRFLLLPPKQKQGTEPSSVTDGWVRRTSKSLLLPFVTASCVVPSTVEGEDRRFLHH
ncbi:hypothetical protein BHE74_00059289 [Ensete ventricosum]|nr:hypothetical protein BHE74_00059289 [Ensete ventricosum]